VNLNTSEGRAQEIKLRRLEITATLAQWKRDFFTRRIERSMADRTTLEAEYARLSLESHVILAEAIDAKVERRAKLNGDLLRQLLAVLEERGLDDVVAEARQRVEPAS
jgi:hypothetical protein